MAREIAVLADTLEKLREGATNFETVGKRLEATSTALEELSGLYGRTLGEAVRRSSSAAEAVRTGWPKLPERAARPAGRRGERPPADDRHPGFAQSLLAAARSQAPPR